MIDKRDFLAKINRQKQQMQAQVAPQPQVVVTVPPETPEAKITRLESSLEELKTKFDLLNAEDRLSQLTDRLTKVDSVLPNVDEFFTVCNYVSTKCEELQSSVADLSGKVVPEKPPVSVKFSTPEYTRISDNETVLSRIVEKISTEFTEFTKQEENDKHTLLQRDLQLSRYSALARDVCSVGDYSSLLTTGLEFPKEKEYLVPLLTAPVEITLFRKNGTMKGKILGSLLEMWFDVNDVYLGPLCKDLHLDDGKPVKNSIKVSYRNGKLLLDCY